MGLLALMRKSAYWTLDALRGGPVREAYNDIKKIDQMDSSAPFVLAYRKRAWNELQRQATQNVDFYRQFSGRKFSQFPVITKNEIRAKQDAFMSSAYKKEDLAQMSTSGSTGTPFVCYQNSLKKKRVNAEIIYFSEKVGYKLGENLSYMRTVVRQNKKSGLRQLMQNQTLINCGKLSDAGIGELIAGLGKASKKGSVTLLAYGSTYKAIYDYAKKHDIKRLGGCQVTGAISGSDMLFDDVREAISRLFGGIEVVSRYSNEENGVLGQDEGLPNTFPVNEADYVVEILDEDGDALPEGSLGRIVVTDLFNYAMPMIRYDTGDMGAIKTIKLNGRKKRCICDFSGRKADVIFDTEGDALSPYEVTNHMWSFPDVMQFQLIQKDKREYLLKLNVPKGYKRASEVVGTLRSFLGSDADIVVEIVHEIPVLASGKRRYIVNEYMK